MSNWSLDVARARDGAREAAGNPDPRARACAYEALCQGLGEAANAYVCPPAAVRELVREAVRAYQAERRNTRRAVEYTHLSQLIGFAGKNIVFQVEYVENESDCWDWNAHSQHQAKLMDPCRIGENRQIFENAKQAANAEAKKISDTYEEVRVVKVSSERVWNSGKEA
ncbi:hypothetical protein [Streptomyces sp. NPDC051662]|uniref:hypothetical protein n=1 Tax=Streptomyces sp. NPDC051662 TaxID=3154750 RepID=UPI0034237344